VLRNVATCHRVLGLGFWAQDVGFGFRVQGSGLRVLRVCGLEGLRVGGFVKGV